MLAKINSLKPNILAFTKRTKTSNYRLGISNDLVVSASMGWSAK